MAPRREPRSLQMERLLRLPAFPQPPSGSRDQVEHLCLRTGLRDLGDGFAFGRVLQTKVESNLAPGGFPQVEVRAENYKVAAQVGAESRQGIGA